MKRKSVLVLPVLITFFSMLFNFSYIQKDEKIDVLHAQGNEITETNSENNQDPNRVNPIQGIRAYTTNKYIENDSLSYVIVEPIGEGAWLDDIHFRTDQIDICYIADDGLIVFDGLHVTGEVTVEINRIKDPTMKTTVKFIAVTEHKIPHIYDDYENSNYSLKGKLISIIGNEGVIFDGKDSVFIKSNNPLDENLLNHDVTVTGTKSIEGNEGTILSFKEGGLVDHGLSEIEYDTIYSDKLSVGDVLTKGGSEIIGTLKVAHFDLQIADEDCLTVRVCFKDNIKNPDLATIIYLKPRVKGTFKELFHSLKDQIEYPLGSTIYLDFKLRIVSEKPVYLRLDDPRDLKISRVNPYSENSIVNINLNLFLSSLKFEGDDAISKTNHGVTDACRANYLHAKQYYDELIDSEIALFRYLPRLSDERLRYAAWCNANNDTLPFNSGNQTSVIDNDICTIVLSILGVTFCLSMVTYTIYRKRKNEE